jgi:Domain of unknown function (DUF4375)
MSGPDAAYWAVVKPMFGKIDTGTSPENYLASIAGLPRSEVGLFAAHFCLAEIFNGGLLQFFWNAAGVLAPEAAEGFVMVGMTQMAALIRGTIAQLGDPYPRDRDDRWDALLSASGCNEDDFILICKEVSSSGQAAGFHEAVNFYRAFLTATEPMGFDKLNEKAWDLAETENGGFAEAANRYVLSFTPVE